jgi:hypothetical protein
VNLTNKSNLPEAILKAMKNDSYDSGDSDFTATSLLKPARASALEKKHKDETQEDAEDGIYRLYGQIAHGILERANENDLSEKRFFSEFKGYKVSAQIDTLSLKDGVLSDFKFTTAWGFKKDTETKPDWIAQLNIQLELMRRNGLDAQKLQIVGLLRDWQISKAKEDPNYPQNPIVILDIPMWSRKTTQLFIEMRIAAHVAADVSLPECSSSERWAKPDVWAVIKKGQKRAINGGVQLSQELAEAVMQKTPGTFIEHRPGESVRCKSYCRVSTFCNQAKGQASADEEVAGYF